MSRRRRGETGGRQMGSGATPAEIPPTPGGWWLLLAMGIPFLVYLRTLAPTVYGLDSAELSTGAYVLGIVHPPGSPLYLLLGHLFTWLPVGDVGYRLNLFSATAAVLALGFVYAILCRLTGRRDLSLAGAWFLAFSYYFWIAALAAELYALHVCIVAALIWLALAWRARQQAWQFCAFALLFGVGLGNHLSLIVLTPGFAWLLCREIQVLRQPRVLVAAAACALLGVSIYGYLPLRADASMNFARELGVDVRTWQGFWWVVSGRVFAGSFFAIPPVQMPVEAGHYLYRLWSNFLGLGCLLGLIGLRADFQRRPVIHTGLGLMFAAHLLFMLSYDVPDRELMLGPSYLIWSLWTTLGVAPVVRYANRLGLVNLPSAATVLLALGVGNFAINFPYADISSDWSARQRGEAIFAALPSNATYIGTWVDVPILEYLQVVEGQRFDVRVVNLFFSQGTRRQALIDEIRHTAYPVYTSAGEYFRDTRLAFEDVPGCDCQRVQPASVDAVPSTPLWFSP